MAGLLPNNFRRNEVNCYKVTRNLKRLTKTKQRKMGDRILTTKTCLVPLSRIKPNVVQE
ncbi:hypothetical protein YC2023_099366 [Brassica napus]